MFSITPESLRLIAELEDFKGQWRMIRRRSPSTLANGKPGTLDLRLQEFLRRSHLLTQGKGRGTHYVRWFWSLRSSAHLDAMKRPRATNLTLSTDYRQFVTDLKSRIATARLSAARHVNRELVTLYWDIGRGIVEKQKQLNWGESVVEMVAADLRNAFPDMHGFSSRNVWDMKRLYESYSSPDFLSQIAGELSRKPQRAILRQAVAESSQPPIRPQAVAKPGPDEPIPFLRQLVAEIPWGQNLLILNKLTAPAAAPRPRFRRKSPNGKPGSCSSCAPS